MKIAEKRIERDLHAIQSDIQKLLGDFKSVAQSEVVDGLEQLENSKVIEGIRDSLSSIQSSLSKTKDVVVEKGQKATKLVEEHPFLAVAGALAAGVLLGKFFIPSRD